MTIAKSIQFRATVAKDGTIQLPDGSAVEGTTVDVILNPTTESEEKMTPMKFIGKWGGILKGHIGDDPREARHDHLSKKYL
jgi:hypothetical protein